MKHLIIVKFNEGYYTKEVKEQINDLFIRIKEEVEGINKVSLLDNIVSRPNNADLIICIDFVNKDALNNFFKSDLHIEFKERFSDNFQNKLIFDYEE